jgi:hypothetical protein
MNGFHDWSESFRSAPRWAWHGDGTPSPAAADDKEDALGKVLPVEFTGQREIIDPTIGDPRQVQMTRSQYKFLVYGVPVRLSLPDSQQVVTTTETQHTRFGQQA